MAARHDASPKALMKAREREASKPGRNKLLGRGSGLTPRVRQAVELMIYGRPGDPRARVTLKEAAETVGISERTLKAAVLKPAVMAFHQKIYEALRTGEKPASVRVIAAIRDDVTLRTTAAGQKVQLEAAKALAYEPSSHQVQVNTQVNVDGRSVTPGYVIDLRRDKDSATTLDDMDRAALCGVRYSLSETLDRAVSADPETENS